MGGRVDVVGETPVPTLIYQRREHQIALTEMPASSATDASSEPRRETRDGYSILEWTEGGRVYAAVSDLPPAELDAFGAAFRRAAAAEREDTPKPRRGAKRFQSPSAQNLERQKDCKPSSD